MQQTCVVFLLAILVAIAVPLPISRGEVPLQANFNIQAYIGQWYEIYRVPMPFEYEESTDNNAQYAVNANETVAVLNSMWLPGSDKWDSAKAVATVVGNAHLSVNFEGDTGPAGDYRVLSTDYYDVAVVYSLSISPLGTTEFGWILSRSKTQTQATIDKAFGYFETYTGLTRDMFVKATQDIAPYPFPEKPGNEEVPLQPGFVLKDYIGLWYELYRVPMWFEDGNGTDGQAQYAINCDGNVAILNAMYSLSDGAWDSASATGTIVGNAQLSLQFDNTPGPAGDYRVLYTDYDNIAIVYSQSTRLLGKKELGWILSRKTSQDEVTINEAFGIFASRTGLKPDQFVKTPHGYAPFPFPDKPDDVELQSNFNLNYYVGRWYELYRTPLLFEDAEATDVQANYDANADGTVAVLNAMYLPSIRQWESAEAVATVVGNAQLSVDFILSPGPPGDYRVLYTDYDNIAVVYSLSKTSSGRSEYGWILSRETSQDEATIEKAFGYFTERTCLTKDNFLKTTHGVAPFPNPGV